MRHDVHMMIDRQRPEGRMEQPSRSGAKVDAPVHVHRLFFALFPDEAARRAIARVAEDVRLNGRMRGRWIDPSRYHITLNFLGDHVQLRQDVVDRAVAAAMKVKVPAFTMTLEHMASFHGRNPPVALRCADGAVTVHPLWQALRSELSDVGLGVTHEEEFTPHITLFYSDSGMIEPAAVEPIEWTVREFVLVHSLVGRKDYRILARWGLPG